MLEFQSNPNMHIGKEGY